MQQESGPRSNKSRTEATRGALLTAARQLFSDKGYAETSTPDVVKAAGVTRGALYHHFDDKEGLFRAVLEAEFQAVAADIEASSKAVPVSTVEALRLGSRAYLTAMQDPGRARIMLLDGPAVLGRAAIDAIGRDTSEDTLRRGLGEAMAAGDIRTIPLEPLVIQLSALFDRAALAVAEGSDPEAHLEVLDALFGALAHQ